MTTAVAMVATTGGTTDGCPFTSPLSAASDGRGRGCHGDHRCLDRMGSLGAASVDGAGTPRSGRASRAGKPSDDSTSHGGHLRSRSGDRCSRTTWRHTFDDRGGIHDRRRRYDLAIVVGCHRRVGRGAGDVTTSDGASGHLASSHRSSGDGPSRDRAAGDHGDHRSIRCRLTLVVRTEACRWPLPC